MFLRNRLPITECATGDNDLVPMIHGPRRLMANIERLDDTDRRLLRVLQSEGRISNQELAERCHLSPSACSDRVRRLRDAGYIKGFAALLDPERVGRAL